MMTMLIALGVIVLLYFITWSSRDSFVNRMVNVVPALYETSKATLTAEMEKIRLNGDILDKYKDWTADIFKQICEGRANPNAFAKMVSEEYPDLSGEQFSNLSAVINSGLTAFMVSQKECFDEAFRLKGDMNSVFGGITIGIWKLIGMMKPMAQYMIDEPKYLVSLKTEAVSQAFESGTMPRIEI